MAAPHKATGGYAPRKFFCLLLAFLALGIALPLQADERNWLPPGSTTEISRIPPAELIRPDTVYDRQWLYGRLLFRSPALLGERAVRIGLSCNSCHVNGHINRDFYIDGLSDRPGRIDVTHRFWQAGFDDGLDNPLGIPSLRGVRDSPPYGSVMTFPDLIAFTSHVIVTEFAGPEPEKDMLNALVTYLQSLDSEVLKDGRDVTGGKAEISYLPLLSAPIETGNFREIDRLYDLIRGDYGRRAVRSDADPAVIRRDISLLKSLHKKAAANDFAAARARYSDLVASQ